MLRNSKYSSLVYKSLKNRLYQQGSITICKRYSSIEEDKPFWEIEAKKRTLETPKTVKNTTDHVSEETKEFRALLEELFSRTGVKTKSTPVEPAKKKADTIIEEKLLDMVKRNRKPYKPKSPLPRSVLAPMYGKTTDIQGTKLEKEEESIFDFLNAPTEKNWNMEHVAQNENIQLKQKEIQSIQAIVEAKSDIELLDKVQKEINQNQYPSYYSKVVVKAIEQATKMDPYLALTIFEMAKTKSVQSYISACTTEVYNILLLLRWNSWRDIYGMLDLMEEMQVNGVQFDNDSRRIVREVVHEIESEGKTSTSIFWNSDEQRYCNLMKELAGKWMVTK